MQKLNEKTPENKRQANIILEIKAERKDNRKNRRQRHDAHGHVPPGGGGENLLLGLAPLQGEAQGRVYSTWRKSHFCPMTITQYPCGC